MKTTLILITLTLTIAGAAEKTTPPPTRINITLGELIAAQQSLGKLFHFDLPVKQAWDLRKVVTSIEVELKRFEEQRLALVKKHGRIVDGNQAIPPENVAAFSADYKSLTEISVTLDVKAISLDIFGEQVKLSAYDMAKLEMFLAPPVPSK